MFKCTYKCSVLCSIVIMEEGLLFLSRPYKFRCQNGDFVIVETEWSSFINPWGKKLEFIIGNHRVLTVSVTVHVWRCLRTFTTRYKCRKLYSTSVRVLRRNPLIIIALTNKPGSVKLKQKPHKQSAVSQNRLYKTNIGTKKYWIPKQDRRHAYL